MNTKNKLKCPKHDTGGGPCYCDNVSASDSNELLVAKNQTGWVDVNISHFLKHGEHYLTRVRDVVGSKGETLARCHISAEGDEVWFTVDNKEVVVDEVHSEQLF